MTKLKVLPEERKPLLEEMIKLKLVTLVSLDVETCPMTGFFWGLGKQFIGHTQVISDTKLIMAQYIFAGDAKPTLKTWDKNHDDTKIVDHLLTHVFNKPNLLIVGQNQKAFDLKTINHRASSNGTKPINFASFLPIDILQLSRKSFRRASHKLDVRSKEYGYGGKHPMNFQDWIDVFYDKPGALAKMAKYGLKDPVDTLKVFWRELPYYSELPAELTRLLRDFKATKTVRRNKEMKETLLCQKCRKKHRQATNVKVYKAKQQVKCLNCNAVWSFE